MQSSSTLIPDGSSASTALVRVLAVKHPFSQDIVECRLDYGLTLREILGECGDALSVTVDGEPCEAQLWQSTRPPPGSIVQVAPIPQGNDAKAVILTIGIMAAAFFTGGAFALAGAGFGMHLAAAAAVGGVFMAGQVLMAALIKPPTVQPEAAPRRLASVTGLRNDFRPYEPVPVIYGRMKIFPCYAALPWSEVIGDDQYYNCLFALGVGDHDIEQARIGDTLLTNYQGVELLHTKTPSWPAIIEDPLNAQLKDPNNQGSQLESSATYTTADNIEAISVDFVAPLGLRYTTDKGERFGGAIDFRIEYRAAGSSDPWSNAATSNWVDATHGDNTVLGGAGLAPLTYVGPVSISPLDPTCFRVAGSTSDTIRFGVKWFVEQTSPGQWDVRVTRVAFYSPDRFGSTPFGTTQTEWEKSQEQFYWTALRSHDVWSADGVTAAEAVDITQDVDFLQLRIKASDTVQGQLDQFSVIATRKLRQWDQNAQTFTDPIATRNPAWAYIDALTGKCNARPITDAAGKIILDEIAEWAVANETANRKFDRVFDQLTTVFEVLGLIAAAGRAGRSLRDARFTVITEEQSDFPTQIFTPRNSSNFQFSHRFLDMPHALKCRFISAAADWKEDELYVCDDGYTMTDEEGKTPASKFEAITFDGKTDPAEIHKFARYHLAQARLRPAVYTLDVDIEYLASVRGDLVHVEHDVLLWTLGRGRITRIVGRYLTLDETFPIQTGVNYRLKIRCVTDVGTVKIREYNVSAPAGTAVNTFLCANTPDSDIALGDLCILGVSGQEDVPLKILAVEPKEGLAATLTMVDAAPEILLADQGEIPAYDPHITNPVTPQDVVPPAPIIIACNSGNQLGVVAPDGSRMARLEVAYFVPSFEGTLYDQVEARMRKVGSDGAQPWVFPARQSVSGGLAVFSVEPGETYQIQLRVITVFGKPSPWSAPVEHTVAGILLPVPPPGGIAVMAGSEGIAISLDVAALTDRTLTRMHVRLGVVDDRDDASTVSYWFPIPRDLEDLDTVDAFIPMTGAAQTYYVWARFEDAYGNYGTWYPLAADDGILVDYPGQLTKGALVTASAGLSFIQAGDGTWNATQTDLTFEWKRAGVTVATRTIRVLRTGSALTDSLVNATGEPTHHGEYGSGSSAITVLATHTASGETVAVSVQAIVAGGAGTPGEPGAAGAPGEGYWTPTITANMTQTGKSFAKASSDGAWNGSVYSVERYGSCMVAWQPADATNRFMIGLDQSPSGSASYETIDHALFCGGPSQGLQIWESGVQKGGGGYSYGSYAAGDQLAIQYDGKYVRYLKNGVVLDKTLDANKVFYLDSSFYDVGAQADNLSFVPMPGGQIDLNTQIAGTLQAIFAEAGLINENVTINADGTLTGAGGGQVQINQLPGSVTTGQLVANVIAAVQAVVLNLAAIRAELGDVQIGTAGSLRSGKTAFSDDASAGFWMGIDAGAAKMSVGGASKWLKWDGSELEVQGTVKSGKSSFADSTAGFWMGAVASVIKFVFGDANKYVSWDGSELSIAGTVKLLNAVQTFTPSWGGFSVNPTGDVSYLDLGAVVIMFTTSDRTGTSGGGSASQMVLGSLPVAIRPSNGQHCPCVVIDGWGGAIWQPAVAYVSADNIQFAVAQTDLIGNRIGYGLYGFRTSYTKGLPSGWLIVYAK